MERIAGPKANGIYSGEGRPVSIDPSHAMKAGFRCAWKIWLFAASQYAGGNCASRRSAIFLTYESCAIATILV
jgi:hypothetical protein